MIDINVGRVLVNVFIILVIAAFWLFDLPKSSSWAFVRKKWLEKHMKRYGFAHGWGMFAPTPININRCLRVEIILEDDRIVHYNSFDFDQYKGWKTVYHGRKRKYQEHLTGKRTNILSPSYCSWVLKEFEQKETESIAPKAVKLYRQTAKIKEPGKRTIASLEYIEELAYHYKRPTK